MLSFAFRLHFREEGLKALMFHNFVILITCDTVGALLKRTMIASVFDVFNIIFSDTQTVQTFSARSMIAVTLFDFFLCKRLLVLGWTLCKFWRRRSINHVNISIL